jgi:hypothetical protein
MSCGGSDQSELIVPRGATISVSLLQPLDSVANNPGDRFQALVSSPLQREGTTYVPLDADAEGIVEEARITVEVDPRARISLRLTGIRIPSGELVALRTLPVIRESGFAYHSQDIEITTGLDVDLEHLLGRSPAEDPETSPSSMRVEIPAGSLLVFTLEEDVSIPAP